MASASFLAALEHDARMDGEDTKRLEQLRSRAQTAYARLGELSEMDPADLSPLDWDRQERNYFDSLAELDGALEEMGLQRTDDLDSERWHEPLRGERQASRTEPDRSQGLER